MGPLAFLFVAVRFVSRHVTSGELSFEYSKRPSFSDLKGKLTAAKGIVAKVVTANAWYEGALARGSWDESKASVWWGFLISDIVGTAWIYSAWLLVKKLWLTFVLNSIDGVANAVLAIIAQVVDTTALLYLRPFVDRKTDVTEIAGALLNLLAFIVISLPTILGPDIPVPEFLGAYTTMVLATLATVLAAVVSLMSPLALIVRFIYKACSLLSCVNFKSPSVVTTAYHASKADVTAGIKGEMQACVEEAYIPPEENDEEATMLWDDGTAFHTAALAAVGAAGGATNPKTGSVHGGNPVEIEPMAQDTLKTPALITSNSFSSKADSQIESVVSPATSQRGIRQIIWDSESAWSSSRTMRADDVNVLPSFPLNYAVSLPPSSMGRSPMVSNGSTPPLPLVIAPLPTSSPPSFRLGDKALAGCSDGSGGRGVNLWASATALPTNMSEGRTWPSMPDSSRPPPPLAIAPLLTSSPPSFKLDDKACFDGSGGSGTNLWASATAHPTKMSQGRTWTSMPDQRTFSSSYFSESSGMPAEWGGDKCSLQLLTMRKRTCAHVRARICAYACSCRREQGRFQGTETRD